jgi:hypothetical protein
MESAHALVARAHRLQDQADRAFRRWVNGDVRTARGAGRLQALADEAWCDVRLELGHEVETEERNR